MTRRDSRPRVARLAGGAATPAPRRPAAAASHTARLRLEERASGDRLRRGRLREPPRPAGARLAAASIPTSTRTRSTWTSLRIGLKGELTRHFDFEIERELDSDGQWQDWKDVYLNWDTFDRLSVRGGRFKMPFGFEQNLGRTELDFIYRARASTQLTPARDKGVDGERTRVGPRLDLRSRGVQHRRRHRQAGGAAVRRRAPKTTLGPPMPAG